MTEVFNVRVPIGTGGTGPPGPVIATSTGTLVYAFDGDTYTVRLDDPLTWSNPVVRYFKVSAPEIDGPDRALALASKAANESLTLGKTLQVQSFGIDKFGRILAKVRDPSVFDIGLELVALSLAWVVPNNARRPFFDRDRPEPPYFNKPGIGSEVFDGDTIRVDLNAPIVYSAPTVRLFGVDCAEIPGVFADIGNRALDFIDEFAVGQAVSCDFYGVGKFGRPIADIEVDGLGDLATALLTANLAQTFPPAFGSALLPGDDFRGLILLS